jgi:hypothetical protein
LPKHCLTSCVIRSVGRPVVLALAILLFGCTTNGEQVGARPSERALPVATQAPVASASTCGRGRPPSTGVMFEPVEANIGSRDLTICDVAGGWSMVVPPQWFERPSRQHGREIMSYDPAGMDNSGSIPGPGQILVRLQMYQNPNGLDPAAFAVALPMGVHFPTVRSQRQVTIAGQPAELYELGNVSRTSPDWPETTLLWYLRSPFFADRMVVISLYRPESALRAEGERIVASLRFFQPTPLSFVPKVSRGDAIARVTSQPGLALTRIESKLVLRKELQATGQFGIDWYTDPDALTWVVVYAGSGIHQQRFGGVPFRFLPSTPAPTQAPCLSGLVIFPADGEAGSQIGPGCNAQSSWPTWFDSLIDHGP